MLEEPQKKIFEQLMQGEHMAEVRAMRGSLQEWAMNEARQETSQKILLTLATKRFGAPKRDQDSRLREIQDPSRIEALIERVYDVQSWDELLQSVATK